MDAHTPVDEHFPPAVAAPDEPVEPMGDVKVLGKVVPIHERTFQVECASCKTQLRFGTQHVFRTYVTTWAWVRGIPDGYDIKCPYCASQISVRKCLPEWVAKRI